MTAITEPLPKRIPGAALDQKRYAACTLLTVEQLDAHYDDATLDYMHRMFGDVPWTVHIIGPDEIHTHVNPDLDDHDPANAEFTQRTALKFAAESNAFVASLPADKIGDPPLIYHAVVFHNGERWFPSHETDAPAGEYCEWFDWAEKEWFCNQCFQVLDQHCPDHAPTRFPGLRRLECFEEPGTHPAVFMYADNQPDRGTICFYCILADRDQSERWSS